MMKFRQKLLAGIGALALSAAPALAGSALAQGGVGTTTGTSAAAGTTSAAGTGNLGTRDVGAPGAPGMATGSGLGASAPESVEDRGYSGIEPARRASVPHDQLAFNAVDPVGNPVLLIVDRSTGSVIREKEMRKLPTPSKNQ